MNAFPMPCGRLDWHDPHDWTRPREPFKDARTFNCVGRVLLERGMWADWDAADDAAEARVDREKRDVA